MDRLPMPAAGRRSDAPTPRRHTRWRRAAHVALAALGVVAGSLAVGLQAPTARASADAVALPSPAARATAAFDRERVVRFRYEVRNPGGDAVLDAHFSAFVPVAETATQRLVGLTSTHPTTIERDPLGNQVARIAVGTVPPYGVVPVILSATLRTATAPQPERLRRAAAARAQEPSPLAQSGAPEIVSLATRLTRDTAGQTARAIHGWVTDHLRRDGYRADDRGALAALAEGRGDCSEQAWIFVALARAAGVPARFAGGWVVEAGAVVSPEDFHNWAVFHDGATWRIADPHGGRFDEAPADYVTTNFGGPLTAGPLAGHHRFKAGSPGLTVRMIGRTAGRR